MLRDASQHQVPQVPAQRGAEWAPRQHWSAPVNVIEAMGRGTAPRREAVEAYANEGRWVIACPDCSGAQLACRTDPRFMCNECANVVVGGLWRPVLWPDNVDGIEAALADRKLTRNRNWVPGETVARLRQEQAVMEQVEAGPTRSLPPLPPLPPIDYPPFVVETERR